MISNILLGNYSFLVSLTVPESSFLESRNLRKIYKEVRKYVKIGAIFLTRYEKARIVGARALQISFGAPILIEKPINMIDPIKIAQSELREGILPLTIRRELPSGEWQDIPINKLILKKD
jgi:DNA-directed RNA polymerase subunit K/omega